MRETVEPFPPRLATALGALFDLAGEHGSSALRRVLDMLDIALGTKEPNYPDPQYRPRSFYVPGLRAIRWHDISSPPLVEVARVLEHAYPAIRREGLALLENEGAWAPYAENAAVGREFEGLADQSWEICHVQAGDSAQIDAIRERCPVTFDMLDRLRPFRTDGIATFSLLHPGAEIKPHHGDSNSILVCHLPLVVPDGCGMDVAGETRPSKEGQAFVFDDSFSHSAWNRSSKPRLHFFFQLWHPDLTTVERQAIDILVASFPAIRRQNLADRLLRLLVDERISTRGRAPATADELTVQAIRANLERVQAAGDELQNGMLQTRIAMLRQMRSQGLLPALDWERPRRLEGVVHESDRLKSRAASSFAIVAGLNAEGTPEMYIEAAELELVIEEAWIPFFERILNGQPFLASEVERLAPGTPPDTDTALEYLNALRREGLLLDDSAPSQSANAPSGVVGAQSRVS